MEKREKIAPKEQFRLFSTIFCCLLVDLCVKTGTRFALRDKRVRDDESRLYYTISLPLYLTVKCTRNSFTLSALQTKINTCANNVNQDETARDHLSHLDLHCLPF